MEKFIYRGKEIKRVGIFGAGKSNLGVVRYLRAHYPELKFTLRCDSARVPHEVLGAADFDRIYLAAHSTDALCEDMLFLSPTVRRDRITPRADTVITSDAEFFFDKVSYPVFSVTGSDGKSTTTTLASLMLASDGARVPAIGNIGVPMTPQLDVKANRYAVAELSSFQLMSLKPHSRRALITNVSPNHLDFHASYEEYVRAKLNILADCEERVFNFDCGISRSVLQALPAYALYSMERGEEELRSLVSAEAYVTLSDGFVTVNGAKIFDTGLLKCKNRHTVCNFLAATALTHGYARAEGIRRVASEFSGLAHRCELVGIFSGVRYVNSSIDSTPRRTVTTLSSFDGRLIIILGGKSKGLDYRELYPALTEHAKHVILTGACRREIADALTAAGYRGEFPITERPDFREAVLTAISLAKTGDTVILSPASTSFDAFSDFEERGRVFTETIRNHYYKRT